MSKTAVPAAAVRAWFAAKAPEGVPAPGKRGRIHPETVAAFNKANRTKVYATGNPKPANTVKVENVRYTTKSGAVRTKTVTIEAGILRDLLAVPRNQRGRFNLSEAADVLSEV